MRNLLPVVALSILAVLASPAAAYQWTFVNPSKDCQLVNGRPLQWTEVKLTFSGACKPVMAVKKSKPVSLTPDMKVKLKGKGDCLLTQVLALDTANQKWHSQSLANASGQGIMGGMMQVRCGSKSIDPYVANPNGKL